MHERALRRFVLPGLLVCFFLSGAAGLIYQVVWSKALGLVFGHTAYAVATVLAVFLGGLAAGSAWLSRFSERWPRPIAFFRAWKTVSTEHGITCGTVRAAVAMWGLSQARQFALEHGMTPSQEHRARRCLGSD